MAYAYPGLLPLPPHLHTGAAAHNGCADRHGEAADPHKSLFANRAIQRSLSPEAIRTILSDLVDHKQAAWDDASGKKNAGSAAANTNAKALIYWKSPAQWGDAIYDWVFATGQNKSIMTLFELSHGDLVQGQGKSCEAGGARPSTDADRLNTFISCRFYELPTTLLRAALKHLSTQGKAQIFAGTEAGDGEGVKFV